MKCIHSFHEICLTLFQSQLTNNNNTVYTVQYGNPERKLEQIQVLYRVYNHMRHHRNKIELFGESIVYGKMQTKPSGEGSHGQFWGEGGGGGRGVEGSVIVNIH